MVLGSGETKQNSKAKSNQHKKKKVIQVMPNNRSDQHGHPVLGVHIPGAVAVMPGERAQGWPDSSTPICLFP